MAVGLMDWTPGRPMVTMPPASRSRKQVKKAAPKSKAAKAAKRPAKTAQPKAAAKASKPTKAKTVVKAKKAKAPARKTSPKARPAAKPAAKGKPAPLEFREVVPMATAPAARPAPAPAPAAPGSPARTTRSLRIALFGASGAVGSRIAEEALERGHKVTGLVRDPARLGAVNPNLKVVRGDVTDPLQVAVVGRSHDVIASAISPPDNEPAVLVHAAKALVSGARETGKPVVAVNGAGSLEVAPGKQLVDSKDFPLEWRPVAVAHRDALAAFRKGGEGVAWTAISPSAFLEPGKRTGKFRLGTDQLLTDKKGVSRISMEDYAVAFVDAIEAGTGQGRITVGY